MKKPKKPVKKKKPQKDDRRQRFIAEYLIDQNATQAAIRAGYSEKTAYSQGGRLLKNVEIKDAVEKGLKEIADKCKVDAAYVLNQAVKLHKRCMQEIDPVTDKKGRQIFDDDGRPLFQFDSHGAMSSLKLVGEHKAVKAFAPRKHEHSGPGGGVIPVVSITSDLDPAEASRRWLQFTKVTRAAAG